MGQAKKLVACAIVRGTEQANAVGPYLLLLALLTVIGGCTYQMVTDEGWHAVGLAASGILTFGLLIYLVATISEAIMSWARKNC